MRKRSFLLLEVLIALLLVIICAVPLVTQPIRIYKEEVKFLEEMELERLADWTFTEVKEILLKNEIPWKEIPTRYELTAHFNLPDAKIHIPNCKVKKVKRTFKLKGSGEKIGLNDEIYRQLGVHIFLNKKVYRFRLPVEKKSSPKQKETYTETT